MIKKLLCRADGNAITGLGHLYRMFAIVEFYKNDYEIVFITHESSIISVIPKEYTVQIIPKEITIEQEPQWLLSNYNPNEFTLLADGYQFISAYQKVIKELGYLLVYIDDLTTEHMYADVVINHSPHCTVKFFKAQEYTQFALGTGFAMLRPKFNEAAKQSRKISSIENAFVCFGGSDQFNLSFKAVRALLKSVQIKEIHVVLGEAYLHQEIYELANTNQQIYLYKNLDEENLCELMKKCQVAIAPSSTILYELCSIKIPVLSGYYVDNQKNINASFSEREVIFNGGDLSSFSVLDFENYINIILESKEIDSYLVKQKELFDGKNKHRFLGMLNQLHISCRKAIKTDLISVFNWSNDVLVRSNSYNSEPIELESHSNWFLKKIKDETTLFLIIEVNGKSAGIVRFEIEKDKSVVGALVSKEFRGQKLASKFLEVSAELYFKKNDQPILAYIKKENIASLKSFEKAHYVYFKEEIIHGSSSFVYKLEKNDVRR